ncbi:MAG: CHASE domain-containing protein, partial [Pyrinomonadaceae bacterium]
MKSDSHKRGAHPRRPWVPYLVLAITLLLTLAATYFAREAADARDRQRFENAARRTQDSVRSRVDTYVALLRAGAALFASNREQVGREQFRAFVERLRLKEHYPGIQGFGFSARLSAGEKEALVSRMRGEG